MTIEKFYEQYKSFSLNNDIIIECENAGCHHREKLKKSSAINNINRNSIFKCRSCSYTADGRNKISAATSYSRSDETRKKMSDAKKLFYKTPAGLEHKKSLSLSTSRGHVHNKYENSKRQGWYPSTKTGQIMFYGSSYELRLLWLLDQDDSILTYETQIGFEWNGRGRCLDCLITYKDGTQKAIEVKPKDRLTEKPFIEQLNDSREHALSKGWAFEICTEDYFGMKYRQIRDWSDEFRKTITGIDYKAHRLEMDRKKANKHYHSKIATNTIDVYCEFCKTTHTALRLTHDKNIARNGRYICEREGGHIAGSKSKKKPDPETKQCTGSCGLVLPFDNFSKGKAQCKKCRSEIYKQKYHEKDK